MKLVGKDVVMIILYGVGLSSLSMIVYTLGPLIAFGDYRPLDNYIVRQIVIVVLIAAVASFGGFKFWRRRKSTKELTDGIAEQQTESDETVLKDKLKDALATLKAASNNKGSYLYDLPWYLLIGPPGSGKTTALINSGLKFPLSSRGATPAAIAGVGGTRYCDWWFTEDAVLIDTAGRYTTQDSDAKADKQSWFAFLDLLKKNRPRQPINGVMVAISLEDMMTLSPAEISAHANAIRARLLELHERLKVDFPVYALFTKADLVAGFVEYFGYLGDQGRKQVWGATFQTADKKRNMVGEVPVEFDQLLERLTEEQLDRLQDEPVPNTRVILFGFPAQMARLKQSIFDFLNQIFEPTRYHANATLRGFYFTSGTQQGSPIDQLIGSLARSFGTEEVAASSYSGQGKSYFLTDLIQKVIIGEAAWVSTDRAAVRRAMIIKAAAFTLIGLFSVGLSIAWWVSYKHNSALIEQTVKADEEYLATAGPLARETIIADRDFNKVLPALHRLRYMPAGYGSRATPTPMAATFGLSQRERLQSSTENAYRVGLERLLRSRLIFRLEELLDTNLGNMGFVYEALKVYLMLGGQQPADKGLIVSWMRRDWADNLYPGAAYAEGRKLLEDHLAALLELETGPPLIELDGRIVTEAQQRLARMSVSQRAYELLKSQSRASTAGDWIASRRGGPEAERVFEAVRGEKLETVRVPEFFTYNGFHRHFIGQLGNIAETVKKDRWVLGPAGEQAVVAAQYDNLPDEMLAIYTRDFIATWKETLAKLRLRKMLTDKPQYVALSAISAPTSPLKQMLESIRDETAVTRERPKPPPAAGAPPAPPEKPPAVLFKSQDRVPGATIEAEFKPFHLAVEGDGGAKLADELITNLNQIATNLRLLTNPVEAPRANASLQSLMSGLRSNAARMPAPFSDMIRAAIVEFEGDVASSTAGQLLTALRDQVIPECRRITTNRYPFIRGSRDDVPLADFARLFGGGGILDSFFKQNLQPHADTSRPTWTWKQDSPVSRSLAANTLVEFQRAALIRDAFFQGGGSVPSVALAIRPPVISSGNTAKLEIGGTTVSSISNEPAPAPSPFGFGGRPPPPPPRETQPSMVNVQWPSASQRSAITVTNERYGQQPSELAQSGPWSMFRLLETGAVRQVQGSPERATASFIVGGQELTYQISTASTRNPFNFQPLREFRCPSGI
jgi:type VI secretion system protein ImpL